MNWLPGALFEIVKAILPTCQIVCVIVSAMSTNLLTLCSQAITSHEVIW